MTNSLRAFFVVLSISGLALLSAAGTQNAKAQEKKDAPPQVMFDKNKVYVISTNLPGNTGAILTNVSVVAIGSIEYLQGTEPAGLPKPWDKPAASPVLIRADRITKITPYADVAAVIAVLNPPKAN
jgi:hypothetical protein